MTLTVTLNFTSKSLFKSHYKLYDAFILCRYLHHAND